MPTSIEPAGVDGSPRSGRERREERAPASGAGPKCRNRSREAALSLPPLPLLVRARLADLPETDEHRRAIQQSADRIADWVPKGIHFGWEKSFENKGKFPATMNKDAARLLVAGLLRKALLAIYPNRREDGSVSQQLRVVVEAGFIVGTRGQQRVRIIIVRDPTGFLVENAFPVHQH
jgi:hypothetical protein